MYQDAERRTVETPEPRKVEQEVVIEPQESLRRASAGQEDQERVHHQEDDTKQHRGEEVLDGSRGRSRKINTWRPEREKERPSRSSRSSESGSRVDQHQTLRSPSVAGLCTRCQSRSDYGCGVELTSQYRMLRRGLLRRWGSG